MLSRTSILASTSLSALVALGFAMPPDQRPTTRVADCTTSGCHAEIVRFQFLHAPAAVDACEICHVYVDAAQHTFKLVEQHEGEPVCSFCHIGKSTFGRGDNWVGLHVHEPVAEGDCVACHNPHGSNMRNLIRGETILQMCASCHDNVLGQQHMHPPVGDKECLSCHQPHSGQFEKLLHQTGRELCLSCHADVMPEVAIGSRPSAIGHLPHTGLHVGAQLVMWSTSLAAHLPTADSRAGGQPTAPPVHIHEPLLGECSDCHNPHGSPHEKMLQKDVKGLCTSCHADIAAKIDGSNVHHSAVLDDRACLNCHSPHHSNHVALLNDQPMALCASCHQKPQQRADGSRVEGMSVLFKGPHFHAPVNTNGGNSGGCSSCHDIHGGTRRALLTANYSEDLYQSFSESSYELCFTCHDSALATQKTATIPSSKANPGGGYVTNFRDGDLNLHYIHVTGPDVSGRSCRFCHDTHASDSPRLMRNAVPYGQWQLPITYRATETGGTCGAGCHREREYRR